MQKNLWDNLLLDLSGGGNNDEGGGELHFFGEFLSNFILNEPFRGFILLRLSCGGTLGGAPARSPKSAYSEITIIGCEIERAPLAARHWFYGPKYCILAHQKSDTLIIIISQKGWRTACQASFINDTPFCAYFRVAQERPKNELSKTSKKTYFCNWKEKNTEISLEYV